MSSTICSPRCWARCRRELRAFLLRCSVLSELTSARCAAVAADPRAAHWLEEIERRGLFVSVLEGPEPTLRLHDLFRDFLQDRLRREMPDELPELHRRAAAGEPDLVRRIGYRVRAGDWTEAEVELAEAGGRIITTVGAAPVLRLLDQFPPPLHARSGRLAHIRCLCAWARWDWPNMREAAERARRAYESAGDRLGAWRAGLYEAISYGSFGFTDEARRRVDAPPPEPLGIDDRAFLAMTRTYQTFDEGRLDVLGQRYGEVIDALESSTNIPLWYHCVPRSMQCGMPGMDGAARPLRRRRAARDARHADAAARARPGAARLGRALGGQGRGRRGVGASSPTPMPAGSARRRTCASSSTPCCRSCTRSTAARPRRAARSTS